MARAPVSDTVQRLESLRRADGDGADLVLSCRSAATPPPAAQLARVLGGFHLLWMDEPCHTRLALKRYPFNGTRPMARVFHADGSVAAW